MTNLLILLSTYNGEKYLQQQLDSVLNQSVTNMNVTVHIRDDGSTDGTVGILEGYDQNIIFAAEQNIGVAASFIELLHQTDATKYDYFAFADQDDVWMPDKVQSAVDMLKGIAGPALYISNVTICDGNLENQKESKFYYGKQSVYSALVENIGVGMTMVFNRELMILLQMQSPQYLFMHDWWTYILASAFGTVIFDKQSHVLYRQHGGNAIGYGNTVFKRYARRFNDMIIGNTAAQTIRQAESFLECYGEMLESNVYQSIREWIDCQNSFFHRVKYLFKMKMFRQRPSDQFFLIVLFLMGRYHNGGHAENAC